MNCVLTEDFRRSARQCTRRRHRRLIARPSRVIPLGGEELVQDLVHLFRSLAPDRLSGARGALLRADAEGLAAAVHSLKSSCAQLGALRAQSLCGRIEASAAEHGVSEAGVLLDALEIEVGRCLDWLGNPSHTLEIAA